MKILITIILIILGSPSLVADNCENPRDDFDGLYCMNKIYIQADKELNTAYKKLTSLLDSKGKTKLKSTQKSWIEKRNSDCSWKDERGFFVNMACATNSTVSRTNLLNDRIRECESTGCQPGKIE